MAVLLATQESLRLSLSGKAHHHQTRCLHLLTFYNDILAQGRKADVQWFFGQLGKRFSIKPPGYLSKSEMMDHVGMVFFEIDVGTHLLMQSYVEAMCHRLGIDINKYKGKSRLLMPKPITDIEPCSLDECKQFMSACGMVG